MVLLFPHAHIEGWRLQQAVKLHDHIYFQLLNDWTKRDSMRINIYELWSPVGQSQLILWNQNIRLLIKKQSSWCVGG